MWNHRVYRSQAGGGVSLVDGLRLLEYRGYDSAGVATLDGEQGLVVRKSVGRIRPVGGTAEESPACGQLGIGHTRWATHGAPTDENAHPHVGGDGVVAVVHNGVIENYQTLKARLESEGYVFRSATDTEVIAHLIASYLDRQPPVADMAAVDYVPLIEAVQAALAQLHGTYGWGSCSATIRSVDRRAAGQSVDRRGGARGNILSPATPRRGRSYGQVVYLADNELAVITADSLRVVDRDQGRVCPSIHVLDMNADSVDRGGYEHYMLKEIFEQPESLRNAMRGRLDLDAATAKFGGLNLTSQQLRQVRRFVLTACGTSWHAALVGEYQMETLARLPVEVEYASELRYRNPPLDDHTLLFCHHPERRDDRHAGRPAGDETQRPPTLADLQCGGQF